MTDQTAQPDSTGTRPARAASPGAACSARPASARPSWAAVPFLRPAAPASRVPRLRLRPRLRARPRAAAPQAAERARKSRSAGSTRSPARWPASVTRTTGSSSRPWPRRSSRTGSRSAARPTRSTSSPTTASPVSPRPASLAKQAIQQDNVDLLFASSTPETVNAVASPGRDPRHPADLLEHPVGVLVRQPGRQPAEADVQAQVHGHVLPGRGAPGARVQADVGQDRREVRQQPRGRRRLPERRRRQRVPRRLPAVLKGAGYNARPVVGLPGRADQLHVDDLPVQEQGRRLLHQRPAAPRLRHHVDPGAAAGLQAEARHGRQGAAVPDRRLRHGQQGLQRRHRLLVGAGAALDLVAHREVLHGPRDRLHRGGPRPAERRTSPTTPSSRSPTRRSPR